MSFDSPKLNAYVIINIMETELNGAAHCVSYVCIDTV